MGGRVGLYGLGAGGASGAEAALARLRAEFIQGLALLGTSSVGHVDEFRIHYVGRRALCKRLRRRSRQLDSSQILKIGSASCRDRVCRYVSISVVAVALKKKQQPSTTP